MANKEFIEKEYKKATLREDLKIATKIYNKYKEKALKYSYLTLLIEEDRKRIKEQIELLDKSEG
jgi:hypothetical protein